MSGNLIVTEQDRDREVPVSVGQVFELRLPENPTTGIRWMFVTHPGVEILEDHNDLNSAPAPGAASERVFLLRVLGGGSTIALQRAQAWEPMAEPDATFSFSLRLE